MNKKLSAKLQAKASKVLQLKIANPLLSAAQLGAKSFELVKGSYSSTITPFDKKSSMHAQFKAGFLSARALTKPPKPVVTTE